MALSIQGATQGVDANEVQAALNAIHNVVILEAENTMRSQMTSLRDATDAVWVGQSAEVFKENMATDMEDICKALDEAYKGVETEFKNTQNSFFEMDENLIERRG